MLLRAVLPAAALGRGAAAALLPEGARAAGYSHDAGPVADNPGWMAQLEDSAVLSELSLPGTHDSLALHGGDAAQTQSMALAEQLRSGVRALDVRCAHVNDTCRVHHGVVDQRTDLDAVLGTLAAFLAANPLEAVLVRLGGAGTSPSGNSRPWEETWASYARRHNALRTRAQGPLIWPEARGRCRPCQQNPTLGEVRGRVVVLQDFGVRWPACYGIPYPDVFSVQDQWELESNWDLYNKWEAVKSKLDEAASGPLNRLYVNYLSAASGAFPYFVSSGQRSPSTEAPRLTTGRMASQGDDSWPDFPRVYCVFDLCEIAFEGINTLTASYLRGSKKRIGVVMADFPGPDLIESIIAQNQQRRWTNEPLHL